MPWHRQSATIRAPGYLRFSLKPGITLATIVRNEARCLERCLNSLRGLVDDVVLVDTGSTDGTQKIGKANGARIIEIEWPNAFDAARNVALDAVETEWTLWLDADEWLVEGAADAIKRAIQNDLAFGFTLIRRDLLPDGAHGEQSLFRLWRTHPEVRFVGVIHEHLPDEALMAAYPGRKLMNTDIPFWHDGFRQEVSEDKLRRNLPLLERELELRPGQYYYRIELANTLAKLGDPKGQELLDQLAEELVSLQHLDEPPSNTLDQFLASYLTGLPDSELRSRRADVLILLCKGWFPRSPWALSVAAQTEIRRGNLQGALSTLRDLERLAATGSYDRATTVHPMLLGEALYTNLALVAHQLGRVDLARLNYERLLKLDPQNQLARENLAALRR